LRLVGQTHVAFGHQHAGHGIGFQLGQIGILHPPRMI
jgi:hypothetical protein